MRYLPLVLRNLRRSPLRTVLTGGAVAFAIMLVCLLLTMPAGFDEVLNQVSLNTRVGVHAKAGLVYPMPFSYLNKVRGVPGVVAATSYTWFGGVFDEDRGVTFPNFAVDADTVGAVFADWDIDPAALAAFERRRDGALVGRGTADRYGWEPGDRITLSSSVFPVALEVEIVGIVEQARNPLLWLQREYLEQALEARGGGLDFLGMVWARVDDPERVASVMRTIDEMFRNSETETATETEKSFQQNFFGSLQGLVTVILIVTGLVALCIVFIAANTASMSVRERMREIAVLKALGFTRRAIFGMLLGESLLLAAAAGALGALASLGLTRLIRGFAADWSGGLGLLGGFVVTDEILAGVLLLSVAIGVTAGAVPSYGAARRGVAATLREVF